MCLLHCVVMVGYVMLRPHREQNTSATPETTCWPTTYWVVTCLGDILVTLVWTSTWLGKTCGQTHRHSNSSLQRPVWTASLSRLLLPNMLPNIITNIVTYIVVDNYASQCRSQCLWQHVGKHVAGADGITVPVVFHKVMTSVKVPLKTSLNTTGTVIPSIAHWRP